MVLIESWDMQIQLDMQTQLTVQNIRHGQKSNFSLFILYCRLGDMQTQLTVQNIRHRQKLNFIEIQSLYGLLDSWDMQTQLTVQNRRHTQKSNFSLFILYCRLGLQYRIYKASIEIKIQSLYGLIYSWDLQVQLTVQKAVHNNCSFGMIKIEVQSSWIHGICKPN